MQVFLGGTCGSNPWREQIVIPALLQRGVPEQMLFNPVALHWTDEARRKEDEVKRTADYQVYVIASPDPASGTANVSAYSLVELVLALFDKPDRTVACFITDGMANHTIKAINKSVQDLRERFPIAPIFTEYDDLIEWLAERLSEVGLLLSKAGRRS